MPRSLAHTKLARFFSSAVPIVTGLSVDIGSVTPMDSVGFKGRAPSDVDPAHPETAAENTVSKTIALRGRLKTPIMGAPVDPVFTDSVTPAHDRGFRAGDGRRRPLKFSVPRFGSFVYRRRWLIIGAWLLVFGVSALAAPRINTVLKGGGYSIPASQSGRAYNAVKRVYGSRVLVFTAVFTRPPGATSQAAFDSGRRFVNSVRARLGAILRPEGPLLTPDRRLVFVRLFSRPRADFGIPLTARVRGLMPLGGGVTGYLTGASAIFYDMEQASDADIRRMEIITFPIAIVILLLIFGTLVGALVPVAMGPLTVSASLAAVFILGHTVDMSIFVLNTVSMLGLGVAIDYSLFMVQRFREELRRSESREAAVVATMATAGKAIVVSALTVAIGFLGMATFGVTMLTSLGIGGSVVVGISLLAALTLLPALLAVLGDRVNAWHVVPRRIRSDNFWAWMAAAVMRRPWRIIVLVGSVVVLLGLPATGLRVGVPGPGILPASAQSRAGDALLLRHLGVADRAPVLVVFRSPSGFSSVPRQRRLGNVVRRICARREVAGVASAPVVNTPGDVLPCSRAMRVAMGSVPLLPASRRVVILTVFLKQDPSSAGAESFVRYIRGLHPPAGISILVGGQTAGQIDFDSYLYGRFPMAILLIVVAVIAVLAVAFRSLLLPLKAVAMNGFSVVAAYGATVLVFQDGFLRGFLGFSSTEALDSIVPIFLFCVLFGLSTDYEVFLLMRAREEYLATQDNAGSVSLALRRTGPMITSAALIMVAIFGAFSFANLVVIKELGFALAVGVFVDAGLIRALLVPAAMTILGRWNWWPGIPVSPPPGARLKAPGESGFEAA